MVVKRKYRWRKKGGGVHRTADGKLIRPGDVIVATEISPAFADLFERIEEPEEKQEEVKKEESK